MVRFIVSSTDTPLARLLEASTSTLPEKYGADVLASTPKGLIGWQRKTVTDLIASISDGRLAEGLPKLKSIPFSVLILEGELTFTAEGSLILPYGSRWTKLNLRNLLRSLWFEHGIYIERTTSLEDTADAVRELGEWMNKEVHRSLLVRPKMKNEWGVRDKSVLGRHFLQGLPGIGPDRADAILTAFGRIPMTWSCTGEELTAVPGIGKLTSQRLWKVLND